MKPIRLLITFCLVGVLIMPAIAEPINKTRTIFPPSEGFEEAPQLGIGGTSGYISTGWSHFYSLSLNAGQTVTFNLYGESGTDFDLYLYDNNGNLVDWSNGVTYPETLEYESQYGGLYFIEVYAYSGTGYYYLDWNKDPNEGISFSNAMLIYDAGMLNGVEGTITSSNNALHNALQRNSSYNSSSDVVISYSNSSNVVESNEKPISPKSANSHYYKIQTQYLDPEQNWACGYIYLIVGEEGTDFDLYIYDSNQDLIDYAIGTTYPDYVILSPPTDITYIKVYPYSGSGEYYLQVNRPQLIDWYVEPDEVPAGSSFTAHYCIYNPFPFYVEVWLGCSIKSPEGEIINDIDNDIPVTIPPGTCAWVEREFNVPSDVIPGNYDVALAIWDDLTVEDKHCYDGVWWWDPNHPIITITSPQPQLCTNPDPPSHDFGEMSPGETATWTFTITNCGGGTLEWTVSDDQSWISVSPTSGTTTTETDTVTVTVDTTGLYPGACYIGHIYISSNGGSKTGTITVDVVPPPDTTPPDTTITSGPSGVINYNTVTFTWTGYDDVTPTDQLLYSYKLEGYDSSWSPWTTSTSKTYYNLPEGSYTFKVRAKDQAGNIDPTPAERSFTVNINQPPNTPSTPSGPASGYVGETYTYTTSTTDPDGDNVKFIFSWGDGSTSETGYVSSGTKVGASHSWSNPGTYCVKVKAVDEYGAESGWSGCLYVTILEPNALWTLMVYMDGDNNLDSAALDDINEMASVGSTDDVKILVLLDRYGEGAKLYYVEQGSTVELADWGEVNMGNPQTLIDFVNYIVSNYPAEHYALVLWNHGEGWKKNESVLTKGVIFDDTNSDYLTMDELEYALQQIKTNIGRDLDIVGFDACLMGMAEVDYTIYKVMPTAIRVGSEECEPWDGWPYDMILQELTANPTMTPEDLATVIVNDYIASYGSDSEVTQSAVYVSNCVYPVLNDFVNVIMSANDHDAVAQAMIQAERMYCYNEYADLYHFAELVATYTSNTTVQNYAYALMNAISDSIIAESHGSYHTNIHGISIYLPYSAIDPKYDDISFAEDNLWDEFLDWALNYNPPVIINFNSTQYSVTEDECIAIITVTLSNTTSKTVMVDYSTSDGTAIAGVDYQPVYGTIVFNPGETMKTFTVPIIDDNNPEEDETVVLHLTNPVNATLGVDTATLIIIDDDYGIQEWEIPINIVSGTYTQSLIFGTNVSATDGFDPNIDEPAPQLPPGATKYAYFQISGDPLFNMLYKDYRPPINQSNPTETWTLVVTSDEQISLSWDTSNVPDNITLIININGNIIDMKSQQALTLDAGEYALQITAGTFVTVNIPLKRGWNLISLPVIPMELNIPSSVTRYAYWYNPEIQNYECVDINNLQPKKGYWVAAISDCNITVTGTPLKGYTTTLKRGWNMIGSLIVPVDIQDIQTDPENSIVSRAYWFDPFTQAYVDSETLEPCKGYWIAAIKDCNATISSTN